MAPLHSLGHDDSKEVQHNFLHHVMPMASVIVLLHSLGQGNQNEVQQEHFDYVTQLALVLVACDANGIINSDITPPRSRSSKRCNMTSLVM